MMFSSDLTELFLILSFTVRGVEDFEVVCVFYFVVCDYIDFILLILILLFLLLLVIVFFFVIFFVIFFFV